MATDQSMVCINLEAGQDLSSKQYYFVTIASDGQVDPTGDGLSADGVLQDAPSAAGYPATIAISGRTKVVAGAAIARGANVASGATGKAKTSANGNRVLGVALEAAAADGDVISILLKVQGHPNT